MTICIFGDSITLGFLDHDRGGWAERLKTYLWKDSPRAHLYNLGVSGDDTDDLIERFGAEMVAREPEVIIFAIGINDSQFILSKGENRIPLEIFQSNFEKMIKDANQANAKVVLVGLTRVGESRASPVPRSDKRYSNNDIERYDNVIRGIAEEKNLPYIDMSSALSDDDLGDGLHPNVKGHKKMFEIVKDFLLDKELIK